MFKKHITLIIFSSLMITACKTEYGTLMKSSDSEAIIKGAQKFYDAGKYQKASDLLGHVTPMVLGQPNQKEVMYLGAQTAFADENYDLAAIRYKSYYESYRIAKDSLAEKALFMAGKSAYLATPAYNLDQSGAADANDLVQTFINRYPNSKYVSEANTFIEDLRAKEERKAYETAMSYYKTGFYKSSSVSFQNFVENFPDSKSCENAYLHLMRSRTELAINSFEELKKTRLQDATVTYKRFVKLYPKSSYLNEVERLNNQVVKELEKYK